MLSHVAAAGAGALLLLGGPTVDAPLERAAPKTAVTVASTGGSGCPGGIATVTTAAGSDSFTLRFAGFTARTGGSASLSERRRNCMVGVNIARPAGWTFTLKKAEYRGNAQLAKGTVGTMQASYYFSASSTTARYTRTLTGPLRSPWEGNATTDLKQLGWAPCDSARTLNINTEVRITPGPGRQQKSQMEMGRGGRTAATYHLSWKKC